MLNDTPKDRADRKAKFAHLEDPGPAIMMLHERVCPTCEEVVHVDSVSYHPVEEPFFRVMLDEDTELTEMVHSYKETDTTLEFYYTCPNGHRYATFKGKHDWSLG